MNEAQFNPFAPAFVFSLVINARDPVAQRNQTYLTNQR